MFAPITNSMNFVLMIELLNTYYLVINTVLQSIINKLPGSQEENISNNLKDEETPYAMHVLKYSPHLFSTEIPGIFMLQLSVLDSRELKKISYRRY